MYLVIIWPHIGKLDILFICIIEYFVDYKFHTQVVGYSNNLILGIKQKLLCLKKFEI